jgi:cytochrome b561
MNPEIRRFSPLQRALHWLMALCILTMLFIGVGMVSTLGSDYLSLVHIHKPLGIAILILALIRLATRLVRGSPPLPPQMPEAMKLAASLSHVVLYFMMIGLPLIGWGMLSAADYPVVVLGMRLPPIVPHSNELHSFLWDAHRLLALCLFALIMLHLAAALFHALIRRDGVFQTMASRQ